MRDGVRVGVVVLVGVELTVLVSVTTPLGVAVTLFETVAHDPSDTRGAGTFINTLSLTITL